MEVTITTLLLVIFLITSVILFVKLYKNKTPKKRLRILFFVSMIGLGCTWLNLFFPEFFGATTTARLEAIVQTSSIIFLICWVMLISYSLAYLKDNHLETKDMFNFKGFMTTFSSIVILVVTVITLAMRFIPSN